MIKYFPKEVFEVVFCITWSTYTKSGPHENMISNPFGTGRVKCTCFNSVLDQLAGQVDMHCAIAVESLPAPRVV